MKIQFLLQQFLNFQPLEKQSVSNVLAKLQEGVKSANADANKGGQQTSEGQQWISGTQ